MITAVDTSVLTRRRDQLANEIGRRLAIYREMRMAAGGGP
jgi:hypothetical protein